MPLVDPDDTSLWDGGPNSLYQHPVYTKNADGGWTVSGHRGFERIELPGGGLVYVGPDGKKLIAALESIGLIKGQRILLLGAGFGWIAEEFVMAGYGPMADGTGNGRICALETSAWVHANKNVHARVAIINADVSVATGRNSIRASFNLTGTAKADWCITEDVLPILVGQGASPNGPNEVQPLCQSCRQMAVNIAHMVTPRHGSAQDPRLNWKSMEEWKAWVSPDYVIRRGSTEVL